MVLPCEGTSQRRAEAGLLVLLAAPLLAQDVKPAVAANQKPLVHRMELYNGVVPSVAYFSKALSETDRTALGDLERAETRRAPKPTCPCA